ncbi:ISL3 family transposase [Sphingobacterium multivorum]|jgi:transposase|uniref:Transposase and inactivated derivatives n=5 Tax=Sphingobacterium TaxID=28453 RepID=A0A2X2JDH8_SPHMU|nr:MULTISPECIES: ISL3 family transposase [Sphingobacterium]HAE68387.1 ISL3 family transposase [Sphingobacterium sp.]QRQ59911.1 ISL3 family transposase [Sphingobacterium multivorum]QRQ60290.1 ISL3 family transposase [Sphingobacterium multivorum]QRQ62101.1 ISL3 family transposase [Sphingobacterium multivorum]QRQ62297.1 ISL3 family transposase [Sphingobacterium multivorum]
MIPEFVLPPNLQLKAETTYTSLGELYISTYAYQKHSTCPICGITSDRVHSRYFRTLLDLPVSGYLVKIKLRARKYFCDNSVCHRKVFTERFDCEIRPYYRRMIRSNELLFKMGLELGGNRGSAISRYVGLPVSSSTMLRVIQGVDIQPKALTSGVIGVDDWAFKKGSTYGTVIVDLERKEVIDLLPDRESDTLAEWLKNHPEIKVVSRDRYGPYALGIKTGAPDAIQVADRFHLIMNLGEAAKKVLQSKAKELKEIFKLYNDPKRKEPTLTEVTGPVEANLEVLATISTANIGAHKQYLFDKVKELYANGITLRQIARITNLDRKTVARYVSVEKLEKRQSRNSTNLESFINYLLSEENHGKTYRELHNTIVQMGFNGKYTQFCHKMNEVYNMPGLSRMKYKAQVVVAKTWSPTKLSLMLYRESKHLKEDDKEFLELLFEKLPQIKQLEQLIKDFKQLFLIKKEGMLQKWIQEASTSECGLKNFAKNLLRDYEAVNNAVVRTVSNGQVEGQVNRIKNIKRKMYGRAGFQLLRKMILAKSA